MKSTPVTLPFHCAQRVGPDLATRIVAIGETALLSEPLLGLIASRECPGHVLLETLDRVPEWVEAGRVIISGFHSPLEQQVLRSAFRRKGRVIKVLARGIDQTTKKPNLEIGLFYFKIKDFEFALMGWMMGLEPTTTGITILYKWHLFALIDMELHHVNPI